MRGATLPKRERICLKKSIDELFATGRAFVAYPLRVVYVLSDQPQYVRSQIMVSVSKKYFRHAVDRNRIKRLVRENYRLSKHYWIPLLESQERWARIAFMCIAKEIPEYKEVERAMNKALTRIARENAFFDRENAPDSSSCHTSLSGCMNSLNDKSPR